MSNTPNKMNVVEKAKRTLAVATGVFVAPAAGVVATPVISPQVQGIINNGNPAINKSLPSPKTNPVQAAQEMAKGFNVSMGEWAEVKSKAKKQSTMAEAATAAKNALRGVSSSPSPKNTSNAIDALNGNSTSMTQEKSTGNSQVSHNGQNR